jgi:hypothetical protein
MQLQIEKLANQPPLSPPPAAANATFEDLCELPVVEEAKDNP